MNTKLTIAQIEALEVLQNAEAEGYTPHTWSRKSGEFTNSSQMSIYRVNEKATKALIALGYAKIAGMHGAVAITDEGWKALDQIKDAKVKVMTDEEKQARRERYAKRQAERKAARSPIDGTSVQPTISPSIAPSPIVEHVIEVSGGRMNTLFAPMELPTYILNLGSSPTRGSTPTRRI